MKSQCKRFWEIDTTGLPTVKASYNEDEINTSEMVKKTMQFKDGHYEVSMPWKSDPETSYQKIIQLLTKHL